MRSGKKQANMTLGKFYKFLESLGTEEVTLDEIPSFAQEDFSKFMIGKTVTPRDGVTHYHAIDVKRWAHKVFAVSGLDYRVEWKPNNED